MLEILQKKCADSISDSLKVQHVLKNRGNNELLLELLHTLSVVVIPKYAMQRGYDYFTVEKTVAPFQNKEGSWRSYFIRAVEPSFQTSKEYSMTEEQVQKRLETKTTFVCKDAEWHLLGASADTVMHELVFYGQFPSGLDTARATQFLRDSKAINAMVITTPALHRAYGGLSSICSYFHNNKPV